MRSVQATAAVAKRGRIVGICAHVHTGLRASGHPLRMATRAHGGIVLIDHQAGAIDPHPRGVRNRATHELVVAADRRRIHDRGGRAGYSVTGWLRGDIVVQCGGRRLDTVVRCAHGHGYAGLVDRQAEHRLGEADNRCIH